MFRKIINSIIVVCAFVGIVAPVANSQVTTKSFQLENPLLAPYPRAVSNGGAYKIIWIDLDDPAQMWDLQKFRQLEKNTGWYNEASGTARGTDKPFPVHAEARITSAQDSVVIYDRQKGTLWMVLTKGSGGWSQANTVAFTSISFLDGRLCITDNSTNVQPLVFVDFLQDRFSYYGTTGFRKSNESIANRTSITATLLSSSISVVNAAGNTASVIRDPLGAVEPVTLRPLPRVLLATAVEYSISDAGINNFYDSSIYGGAPALASVFLPSGMIGMLGNHATSDRWFWGKFGQTVSADGWDESGGTSIITTTAPTGSRSLPTSWTTSTVGTGLILFPNASVSNPGMPIGIGSSQFGFFIDHPAGTGSNENGLTWAVNATSNTPTWSASVDSLNGFTFESRTDTSTIFGKTVTSAGNGTGNTAVPGVIGKADSLDGSANAGYFRNTDPSLQVGAGDFTASIWFNATAFSGSNLFQLVGTERGAVAAFKGWMLGIDKTSGTAKLYWRMNGGGAGLEISLSIAPNTGQWYHLLSTKSGTSVSLYLNGEIVSTATMNTATIASPCDTLSIGYGQLASTKFNGKIDQLNIIRRALTANEVRFLYQRGLHGIQSNVDPHDALDTIYVAGVAADPNGQFFATWGSGNGTRDSVTFWDLTGIPKYRVGSPGGNIKTVALRSYPGSDSLSYVIGTSTKVKEYQSDLKFSDMIGRPGKEIVAQGARIQHFYPPSNLALYDVVVDSAGFGDYLDIRDALAAVSPFAMIFVKRGTYTTANTISKNGIILTLASGVIINNTTVVSGNYVVVNGLDRNNIILNGGTTGHALQITGYGVRISNLIARTTPGGGNAYDAINATTTADSLSIDNVKVTGSDREGFSLSGKFFNVRDCIAIGCDTEGFSCPAGADGRGVFYGCVANNNGDAGCNLYGGSDVRVTACEFYNNAGYGVFIITGTNIISLCDIHDNSGVGVELDNNTAADNNIITANQINSNGGRGVWITGSNADRNQITTNILFGNTTANITDSGTNSVITPNIAY